MRISWRFIVIVIVLALLGVFIFENWPAFQVPADPPLTVLSYPVEGAALGMTMLAILGAVVVLFSLAMAGVRTSALLEFRRYARETDAARKLADEAEVSRIIQLQSSLSTEFAALRASLGEEIGRLREEAEAQHNVLVANLGQIDDRLEREGGSAGLGTGAGVGSSASAGGAAPAMPVGDGAGAATGGVGGT